ncbi:TPA: hypothetical protein EYM82_10540 [Candidatus Poribacteria bacterium]|nr:hypothetical protein [Candidatus Poribacteria bacterium]HIO45872.1 hypothetical protein [Candidatus Poribacteria bacterium]
MQNPQSKIALLSCVLLCLVIPICSIQAQVIPQVTSVTPIAGQRGTTVEIALQGQNLNQVTEILFSGSGISAELKHADAQPLVRFNGQGISGKIPTSNRLTVQITIDPTTPVGAQSLRLVTTNGVSNPQRFIVSDLLEIAETEPNSTIDQANMLTLPAVVNGIITSTDDLDLFRFSAKKDQRLICDVHASRLGSPLDSLLTLFDPEGKEVISNDISNGLDSLIDYTVQVSGDYVLQIRDLRYKSGNNFFYRIRVGELPYLDTIFPLGGKRGTESAVSVTGRNLGPIKTIQMSISPDTPLGNQEMRVVNATGISTNPHTFVAGNLKEIREQEPNNTADQANSIEIPVVVNGKINQKKDIDCFSLQVLSGTRLIFEVNAHRLGSQLDALLSLFDSTGKQLNISDDVIGAEARIDFSFPKEDKYVISIRDLNNQGGINFPYRLSITPLQPDFGLTVTPDNPRVARGGTTNLTVSINRVDEFREAVSLYFSGFPQDFDVSPVLIGPDQTQTQVTITAPISADLGLIKTMAWGRGSIHHNLVERNSIPIYLTVIDQPKYILKATDLSIHVIQGKSVELHILATRDGKFNKPINLSVVGLPANMSASNTSIPVGENRAVITFTTANFGQGRIGLDLVTQLPSTGTHQIVVNGTASVDNETHTQSAVAIPLIIAEAPFVLNVAPIKQSFLFPKSTSADSPVKINAEIIIDVVRQGGFTDKIDLFPIGFPEGLTGTLPSIPPRETRSKITLTATKKMKLGTYDIKLLGKAPVNNQQFEQETPTIAIKVID